MERIQLAARGGDPRPGETTFDAAIARAATVLNAGGIAILPAEGLYGFHARPDLPAAVERLLEIKPRESGRGWIGLIAEPEDLALYAAPPIERAESVARRYWPGPLTLVVPASPRAPRSLVAENGSVALRCPGSDFLRRVVRASGGIILSTSANAPGAPAPASAERLREEIVDLLVDAGPLAGSPSTIAQVEGDCVLVLREGAVRLGEAPLDGPGSRS